MVSARSSRSNTMRTFVLLVVLSLTGSVLSGCSADFNVTYFAKDAAKML
jgi:hypothetical protein